MIRDGLWYLLAAVCEIAGCFAFWAWWRLEKPVWWLVPGLVALILFAFSLCQTSPAFAGRAFAAYGGVYILAALVWMVTVERTTPNYYDLAGGAICLAGAALILWGSRTGG